MKIRSYWLVFAVSAVALLGFIGYRDTSEMRHADRHSAVANVEKPVPNFSFAAHNGSTISRLDLLGKVWVADFIFTSCPGPCLEMSRQMQAIQTSLADQKDFRLVSFSVNPEVDTPATLNEYGRKFAAGPHWYFLTGDKQAIYDIAEKGFLLSAVDTGDGSGRLEDRFIHSTKFAVVDRRGNIRGYYDGDHADVSQQITAAVRHWLAN